MKRPIVISLLIVALLLVGAGISAVIFFSFMGEFRTNSPFDTRNIPSTLEESKTLKVDSGKPLKLKVENAAGDVTVTGADVNTMQIDVVKTAYDSTQARADEEVKSVKYTIEQSDNTITLKYELPKSMNFNNNVNTIDFTITVPNEVTVDVDTSFGEVGVAGTKGNVTIANDFGDITLENIEGALSVSTNSGQVTATSIKAGSANIDLQSDFGQITLEKANSKDITLRSNSGVIELKDVRAIGDIITKTDFGDTKYENGSADTLDLDTNSGKVTLIKITISKEIKVQDDFGEIELEQANAASYDLHTNSGSITVDGVEGKLKAHTDFGNISILNATSVTLDLKTNSGTVEFSGLLGAGPHMVKSDFGGIGLTLPADSKLDVDLKTDFGNINSDLPVTVILNENSQSDATQIIGNINGGGTQLTVKTNSGNISLRVNS
jgi:DUF4097 and DUF4098 domain-containing protein YvlB